jgi:hypothetical protein
MLDTYLEMDRHPDRELLLRARSALDEAIGERAVAASKRSSVNLGSRAGGRLRD